MRDALSSISKALYQPIVPDLQYSQTQYEARLRRVTTGVGRWLDLGCGHRLLPEWREQAEQELVAACGVVVGIDYDLPSLCRHRSMSVRVRGDASALPFADESFDLVTANMVVEHLSDPAAQFREVARVLRPGGQFLFHTPNRHSYIIAVANRLPDPIKRVLARVLEGRASEDVFPTFYRANDRDAIAASAVAAGLEVVDVSYITSTPVFAIVPVVSAVEALLIRQLMRRPSLSHYRSNVICLLRKPC